MASRREFLRSTIAGGGLALGVSRGHAARQGPGVQGGDTGAPNVVSEVEAPRFEIPLPMIPEAEPTSSNDTGDTYDITMQERDAEIVPGLVTPIWGFNGMFPGPTFRVRRGRQVTVIQHNDLSEAMSTHLHGGHTAPEFDGLPTDLFDPGTSKEYIYRNDQPAATLWYHDHAMDVTAPHVHKGLAGFYLIEDPEDEALGLPSGDYDIPLMIADRAFAADGAMIYPGVSVRPVLMQGFHGDTILVNGAPFPYLEVANRRYRFRLLNGSNARMYTFALSTGDPFTVIGTDGGLLPEPVEVASFTMFPAERVEVVVDFSLMPLGESIMLLNTMGPESMMEVLRFDVAREDADDSQVPAALRTIEPLDPGTAAQVRDISLDLQPFATTATGFPTPWLIDGQPFDETQVGAQVALDSVEIWRFTNTTMLAHPMHIHLVMFQVLDRNGQPPLPTERGWKDTVVVGPNETVQVIARFTDYPGGYVFHCHKLEHEDHAMMASFEVV